jgi:hypothetical protein
MGYPAKAYRLIGAVELLAACLLAIPSIRPVGVAIASAVNFIAVALLLKNREYLLASPGNGGDGGNPVRFSSCLLSAGEECAYRPRGPDAGGGTIGGKCLSNSRHLHAAHPTSAPAGHR